MIFVMAAALSPNIGAQLAFRFIGGCFAATPLVCAGGTISDLWTPMERVYAFPIFAVAAFAGPLFGYVNEGYNPISRSRFRLSVLASQWQSEQHEILKLDRELM